MEYYIQGDPTRAEEIKAAFEKLGCDTTGWKFDVESGFFYTHDGRIDIACGKFLINLIKTHPDYKELELPVEPKFKVGDEVYNRFDKSSGHVVIESIDETTYYCDATNFDIVDQDDYELVPKFHYDIDNFHAGMPVLVRDYDNSRWSYVQFSHYIGEEYGFKFNACGIPYIQCIPFNDDTKHLLGTTDMCPEEYVNW